MNTTHEHYLQVVRTTVEPLKPRYAHEASHTDAYEYVVHSHSYQVTPHSTTSPSHLLSAIPCEQALSLQGPRPCARLVQCHP